MFNDNQIQFTGNLGGDPELRYGPSGVARVSFTVFVNDTKTAKNQDPKSHPIRVSAFGELAENVTESLEKGQRVLVVGNIDTYDMPGLFNEEGKSVNRTGFSVRADEIAPSLRWATATVKRSDRRQQGSGQASEQAAPVRPTQNQGRPARNQAPAQNVVADDDF